MLSLPYMKAMKKRHLIINMRSRRCGTIIQLPLKQYILISVDSLQINVP